MPRYSNKKKTYKKRYSRTKGKVTATTRWVKKYLDVEYKKISIVVDSNIDSAGVSIFLTLVGNASAVNAREGNKITMKSMFIRLTIKPNVAAPKNDFVRMMLIKDKQQIADTIPILVDVLGAGFGIPTSLDPEDVGRFSVLWDKTWAINVNGTGLFHFKKYFKMNNSVRFNGTASTDQQRNAVYLMIFTSESTVADAPNINLQLRTRYTDV